MAITVRIYVNRAERTNYGTWSVAYGGGADFTHEERATIASLDDLPAYLKSVAEKVVADPRVARWPGFCVSARNLAARKPNGWDKRRNDRELYVMLTGNQVDAA